MSAQEARGPSRHHVGPVTRAEGAACPQRLGSTPIASRRLLKAVSFDGLERHLFKDDRAADPAHAFNDPRYAGASILVVNTNFGCGSSREHAPQGIARAGFRAIVGESFSEIFLGNAAMLGLPCFVADGDAIDRLQTLIETTPDVVIDADVTAGAVTAGSLRLDAAVASALRDGFVSGQWNPTAMLLDRFEEVRAVAARLPYIRGF
jgi:3-isopropylmalate/(R)-2-methylmalate dehydratase small subunit